MSCVKSSATQKKKKEGSNKNAHLNVTCQIYAPRRVGSPLPTLFTAQHASGLALLVMVALPCSYKDEFQLRSILIQKNSKLAARPACNLRGLFSTFEPMLVLGCSLCLVLQPSPTFLFKLCTHTAQESCRYRAPGSVLRCWNQCTSSCSGHDSLLVLALADERFLHLLLTSFLLSVYNHCPDVNE